MGFWDAVIGGWSVGVPGTPALMQAAHDKWGKSDWAGLFDAATRLADEGFEVSPRLSQLVLANVPALTRYEPSANYFLPDGMPPVAGTVLKNPDYANVMRCMASEGAQVIYQGEIAQDIVDTVRGFDPNPGVMSLADLAAYEVKERPAVCAPFRGLEVCGMGPPSSGALTVGQILGMLDASEPGAADDPQTWRRIGDASRLAFADRGRYMADSDFVPVPVTGLVAEGYLAQRAELLQGDDALPEVSAGDPEFDHAMNWAEDESIEFPSTSHISIVDSFGNALSMTTTIENAFGSRLMVSGFLLNNELTDFSFRSHADGVPIANRVEPGKRPRSSMSPTIVLRDGAPVLAIGEGLTMYLTESDGLDLLNRVVGHCGTGELQFDAFNSLGIRSQWSNSVVRRSGATLRWAVNGPDDILRNVPGTRLLANAMSRVSELRYMAQYHRYSF